MRTMWNERTDRSWINLIVVGALIVMGVVVLQGVVAAQDTEIEVQHVETDGRDVAFRVLSSVGGSRIGVSVEEIEASGVAGSLDEGAYVTDVRRGTPAAAAGFEAGDVVVEFDGERVRSVRQLSRLVQETPAGRTVSATVIRDGARQTLQVVPEAGARWMSGFPAPRPDGDPRDGEWSANLPDVDELRRDLRRARPVGPRGDYFREYAPGRGNANRLGMEVTSVTAQLADYFGVEAGVLVASVESDSVASAAGVQAGDVITALNSEPVDRPRTLQRQVAALEPGETFSLELTRDGRQVTLEGQLEEARSPRVQRREAI